MKLSSIFTGMFCALLAMTAITFGYFDSYYLTIGDSDGGSQETAPYFWGRIDAAGYSDDGIYYGQSPIHGEDHNVYGYHELLSGEWAAAIFFDGLDTDVTEDPNDSPTDRQAMWLTKRFKWPDWDTNSDFYKPANKIVEAWHNPNNPAPLMNTGQSTIRNSEVEITIDYEVVDVNSINSTRSPMSFITDPNTRNVSYVLSDRYIFLQTYTIKNIKPETLTNLEFYQFLHSHGADEYAALVNSTYTDIAISDPLSSYTPINPVHQVGNFRYDITQWNERPFSRATHVDYVGFSWAVAPDWIDNDVYDGIHDYVFDKRTYGTHINIEDRLLNDTDSIYTAEVGGAMGWVLGSLEPNDMSVWSTFLATA